MSKLKKQVIIVIVIILALSNVMALYAAAVSVDGRQISSQAAVVLDFDTGLQLYGYNEEVQRVPASTLKILTAYVILDAIRDGELRFDTVTRISSPTSAFSNNREFSNIRLATGAELTIRQLLDMSIVSSACAATVALAEALSGSERAFMTRMNNKLTELGVRARLYDCWGGSEENRISAHGLAVVTRGLIDEHPEFLAISSRRSITYRGTTYNNTNGLLVQNIGVDGVKTGFTTPAGYCFIGTALREGRRIIIVTLGSTQGSRFNDARILLDHGFTVAEAVIEEYNEANREDEEEPDTDVDDVDENDDADENDDGYDNADDNENAEDVTDDEDLITFPSTANLILDGFEMPLAAYLINDAHYFKLRDIMFLFVDTSKQFGVELWDSDTKTGYLISGMEYHPIGGELSELEGERAYMRTNSRILFDGLDCDVEVYLIDDNNYFKLRDIAIIMDFFVYWVAETRTVIIDTTMPYEWPVDDSDAFEPVEDLAA